MPESAVRGGIYPYYGIRRGHVMVISVDNLNRLGNVVVVEVTTDPPPEDIRQLLAVPLAEADPMPGAGVLCWRLNFARADRLDTAASPGVTTPATVERVVAAVRALIEP